MLLDSHYVIGLPEEMKEDSGVLRPDLPTMRSSSMFIVSGLQGEPQVASPRSELIAELPRLGEPPSSMDRFRDLRSQGRLKLEATLRASADCRILLGRDASPGKTMLFARYVEVMDEAELGLLEGLAPRFPFDLLECRGRHSPCAGRGQA
jgi:hypothetical protein